MAAGCEHSPIDNDKTHATPQYWLDQPAAATVQYYNFDQLWQATEEAARDRFFPIDRSDVRLGLLTTEPMVSKQVLELWRHDVGTAGGVAESSLATIRRTLRFEFVRHEDGTFEMTPKVLVERQAVAERRITSTVHWQGVDGNQPQIGTRETDQGVELPRTYWYAIGRDTQLEKDLAEHVRSKLRKFPWAARSFIPESDP